ncbi:MAG: hypothetical protein ACJ790_03600 [Myxococcaceae bacterium]
MPLALKIFLMSLLTGVGGGYAGFRVAWYLAMRYGEGEYKEGIAILVAIAGAAAVGIASAVTTGVMMGKRSKV